MDIRNNDIEQTKLVINLPTEILKQCKDKETLRCVAVSLYIKFLKGDSIFKGLSIRNVRNTFKVGQTKAKQIIKDLSSNKRYFNYKPYNSSVVAKTFRNKTIVTRDKANRKIWTMYAVKVQFNKDWSLRDLEKHLHNLIYLNAINATERSDKFTSSREIKNNILLTTKDALILSKLAKIGGVCKSTARNHMNKLCGKGIISIKKGGIQFALSCVNENTIREAGLINTRILVDESTGFGYVVSANEYHIINRDYNEMFKHIIFNHTKRLTNNPSKRKPTNIMETELMGAYN